jgi:PhoH-like ATPase
MAKKVYVLDTNIILQNIKNLSEISDNKSNTIVIPETVLLELEDKKKFFTDIGYHARQFARILAKTKVKEVDYKQNYKVVKLTNNDFDINIISKDKYETQIEQHNLSESNDKSEVPKFEFIKSIELDSSKFNSLDLKDIETIDDEYKIGNYRIFR